ncbi:hypothetical protein [Buchananella hordeovulneris]|uniref:hypothetical protein n=1 Tax=Buchananella hordeovulneris TaxID=52770 RepID=UPI0011614A22|nr:hypothetical protein [Buchananella hordeovulneris]
MVTTVKVSYRFRVLVLVLGLLLGVLWVKVKGVVVPDLGADACESGMVLSAAVNAITQVGEDIEVNLAGTENIEGELAARVTSADAISGRGKQVLLRVGESFEHPDVGKYTLMSVERCRNWFGESGGGSVATVCFEPAPGFTPKERG